MKTINLFLLSICLFNNYAAASFRTRMTLSAEVNYKIKCYILKKVTKSTNDYPVLEIIKHRMMLMHRFENNHLTFIDNRPNGYTEELSLEISNLEKLKKTMNPETIKLLKLEERFSNDFEYQALYKVIDGNGKSEEIRIMISKQDITEILGEQKIKEINNMCQKVQD